MVNIETRSNFRVCEFEKRAVFRRSLVALGGKHRFESSPFDFAKVKMAKMERSDVAGKNMRKFDVDVFRGDIGGFVYVFFALLRFFV